MHNTFCDTPNTHSDCIQAETAAREAAQVKNMPYISPYNDPLVVAGQGTIGLELLGALPPAALKTVFVPVGGGGLIAGIAAVLKAAHPVPHSRWEEQASAHGPVHGGEPTPTGADQNALPVDHALPVDQEDRGGAAIRVIGCQPAASDVMRRSVACGGVVEEVADDEDGMTTLSDGTAGGMMLWWRGVWNLLYYLMYIERENASTPTPQPNNTHTHTPLGGVEPHTCTLQPCMDYVDDWVTVTEQEIAAAIVELHTQCNIHCEGAAAMTYACVQKYIQGHAHVGRAGGLVMVCCGGNAQGELLDRAQEVLLSNA